MQILAGQTSIDLDRMVDASVKDIEPGTIVQAKVIGVRNDEVIVDFGGKSEGILSRHEFAEGELIEAGKIYEVFYEGIDEYTDTASVSKGRADKTRAWERVVGKYQEGDKVRGLAIRKIKGGLLVDVEGVHVFLPASQVNIRRTQDISEYVGQDLEGEIIKIDPERQNIVISRRKLLERERAIKKERTLEEIHEGELRMGVVKNIADFGVFIDLGGIDGLLHITDMSWSRIAHPSEMVQVDQEIEVVILKIDRDRERIALGLKQKHKSPWEDIDAKYPVGSRAKGKVVNIVSYGAFVKLEDGVEGLVHISEMSWTRRVTDPKEVVNISDEVEVVVLDIDKEKQEISLGMKQVEEDPWQSVEERYPVGTIIEGRVRNLASYGAFVELEEGIDGLLHVSDLSWTKKISDPKEVLKKGDLVRCAVLSVDPEKKRIALGLKQLTPDPWVEDIPDRYHVGDVVDGHVTKITNFGVFVRLEEDLEGLLHISELSDRKIQSPEEVVKLGQKIEVRVIRVDPEDRKIGLSFVHADFDESENISIEELEKQAKRSLMELDTTPGIEKPRSAEEVEAGEKAGEKAGETAEEKAEEKAPESEG
ncbi:MAG: 30S ribosomal protein S1 [Planctomycetes bacterium]|nr:30S ribosomal protein S1 [Planctomycetota bacterium]